MYDLLVGITWVLAMEVCQVNLCGFLKPTSIVSVLLHSWICIPAEDSYVMVWSYRSIPTRAHPTDDNASNQSLTDNYMWLMQWQGIIDSPYTCLGYGIMAESLWSCHFLIKLLSGSTSDVTCMPWAVSCHFHMNKKPHFTVCGQSLGWHQPRQN